LFIIELLITLNTQESRLSNVTASEQGSPFDTIQLCTQKCLWWGFHSVAYVGNLYLVCAVCDVTS